MPTFDDDELGLSIRTKLNNALTKVDGIEDGATDDQTGAEIKALYELEPSAFTDAQFTKLTGIETGATADQTGAEIKALYEAEADTNAFTDAEQTTLSKYGNYDTRADFVSAVGGLSVPDGGIIFADGLQYKASSGATDISDLPGFLPNGDVFVEHFGAVGDATRPSVSSPTNPIGGTDDTSAFEACRDYIQSTAFQPNNFVGFHGGFVFNLSPNKQYKVVGDNVLGSSRQRIVNPGDPGENERQSWRIEGNNSIIYWEVSAATDALIDVHETFTTQEYRNLSVYVCNASGSSGTFYRNDANDDRNATTRPVFHRVEVYHCQPNDTTNGIKRMFDFGGNNLGDRMQTYGCSFNQAHTFFYSENPEAVGQAFFGTTFTSYLDGATFFHIRTHGSGFHVGGGVNVLMKGDNQTLFKTEYLSGNDTGSNGCATYLTLRGARLEFEDAMTQTLVDADFGIIEIGDFAMEKGGFPVNTSPIIIARDAAVVRVNNALLHGRIAVGPENSNLRPERAYAIKLTNCQFVEDLGQKLFVEESGGSLTSMRDAVMGNYALPAIIVDGTDTRTVDWAGFTSDTNQYVNDMVYNLNAEYLTAPVSKKLIIGRYRGSSGFTYLDNRDYVVLPPYCAITSMKISHASIANTYADEVQISIGSATVSYSLPNSTIKAGVEMLNDQAVIISDNDVNERTISSEILLSSTPLSSPNAIMHLEIEYRPAWGKLEMTTTESAGVRLTRVIG